MNQTTKSPQQRYDDASLLAKRPAPGEFRISLWPCDASPPHAKRGVRVTKHFDNWRDLWAFVYSAVIPAEIEDDWGAIYDHDGAVMFELFTHRWHYSTFDPLTGFPSPYSAAIAAIHFDNHERMYDYLRCWQEEYPTPPTGRNHRADNQKTH